MSTFRQIFPHFYPSALSGHRHCPRRPSASLSVRQAAGHFRFRIVTRVISDIWTRNLGDGGRGSGGGGSPGEKES